MLEETSFRNRTVDFLYLLFLGMLALILIGPLLRINFMGSALSFMIVYIWARRNPYINMNFLGVFNFGAAYLPWFLLGFSFLLSNNLPINDFLGIVLGHIYYFLEDVYPKATNRRLLRTPRLFFTLFGSQNGSGQLAADFDRIEPSENPGNFNWNDSGRAQTPADDAETDSESDTEK